MILLSKILKREAEFLVKPACALRAGLGEVRELVFHQARFVM